MQDLKFALRSLQRRPGFTLLAALTLALGVGATTAIFSVVQGVLLQPLPYAQPDRLARVFHANPQESLESGFSRQDWPDVLSAELPFRELAGYYHQAGMSGMNVQAGPQALRLAAAYVSGNFFRTMGVAPLLGGVITEAHDVPGGARYALLSEPAWRSYFGAASDIVGRTVSVEGEPFTVLGVMPRLFQFPGRDVQIWAPLALLGVDQIGGGRDHRWIAAVARLADGQSGTSAASALTPVLTRLAEAHPETNQGWTRASVIPLHEAITGNARPALLVLLAAVGLVLLIACANLANLLLVRSSDRGRELAVRGALGASRRRLVRQILAENAVLAVLGGALGLLASIWLLDALVRLGGDQIPRPDEIGTNPWVVAFALLAAVVAGLLASVLPAWRAGATPPGEALREGARGGTAAGRMRVRAMLVVAETGLAVLLLVGALLMTRSLWTLMHTDPGFAPERVLVLDVRIPKQRWETRDELVDYRRRLLEHLAAVPGVQRVAGSKTMPLAGGGEPFGGWLLGDSDREFDPEAGVFFISAGYFRTLGTRVLDGREFGPQDRAAADATVLPITINEAAARAFFPGQRPVGQYLRLAEGDQRLEVVGVVENGRTAGMAHDTPPAAYLYWDYAPRNAVHVFLATRDDPAELVPAVRAAVQQFDTELPIGTLQPLAQVIAADLALPRLYTLLLVAFAAAAVLLAALGIYGVIAYSVSLRGHEIGVRLAMGALRRDVVGMVVAQAMSISGLGLALGLLAAFWATRVLGGMLHGVSTRDPLAFALVPLLLAAVSLLAAALPAVRAAATNPMVAIRTE